MAEPESGPPRGRGRGGSASMEGVSTKPGATEGDDLGVEIGALLLGKYRIDAILGKGGMGVVARATHVHLDEPVAIKFLRKDAADDPEASRRFLREAQAAVKLKSEHVARVLDVGTLPDGGPYLVMEFLEGVDLDMMLSQSGRIDPPLAVEFVVQGCAALAEAHSLGIIHRDVKPANFFVTWRPDGSALVKVLDFGISKIQTQLADLALTQTQSVLGTPAYMSPEQMRSARNVDTRSDIWALGTVLYELCEGRRPFEAESFSEMCVKVAVDAPAPFTVELPPGLEDVIMRCLRKDPTTRYGSVGELAAALVPFARDQRQAQILVERIQRILGRGAAPLTIKEAGSGPILLPRAQTPPPVAVGGGGETTDRTPPPVMTGEPVAGDPRAAYPPRKTTPWAAGAPPRVGGSAASPASPAAATNPSVTSSSTSWPASEGSWPGTGEHALPVPPGRPSGPMRSPRRRAGIIAVVAVVTVGGALVVMAQLGGGGARPAAGSAAEPREGTSPDLAAPPAVGTGEASPSAAVAPAVVGDDAAIAAEVAVDAGIATIVAPDATVATEDPAAGAGTGTGTGTGTGKKKDRRKKPGVARDHAADDVFGKRK